MFNVENGRNPKDLNELVEKKFIPRIPAAPYGMKLEYDAATGKVKVVNQVTEQIVILDFGSQYTQVIARRVRECNVYSVILRYDTPAREIARLNPKGLILSGGPSSVYAKKRAAARPRHLRARHPGAGHLLRPATPGPLSRRESRAGPETRIRQRHAPRQRQLAARCLPKLPADPPGLEFARGQADQAAGWVQIGGRHGELRLRRHREPRREDVRPAVSPGSGAHAARAGDPGQLRPRRLRLRQELDDAQLR